MTALTRKFQKIFAGSATNNGVFGSGQAGTKVTSTDVATLQGLSAYSNGWNDAVISGRLIPPLEEFQSLNYINTYQLAYIFQEGIPEWETATEYRANSIVKKTGTTQLYSSLIAPNIGNALPSSVSDSNWKYLGDLANLATGNKSYVNVTGSTGVLSLNNTQTLSQVIDINGTLTGNVSVQFSSTAIQGMWLINNSTNGAFSVTIGYATGNKVNIPQGQSVIVWADGVNATQNTIVGSNIQDFRLTLTSATPVTTADVVGATTIYCTPYKGNRISLYDGTNWNIRTANEFSLSLGTLTSGKPYDVFCYDNAGVPTLEFLAWTNDTTRATALVYQNGILVKSGATTRRYLGSFYTTATTTTEDSLTKRYLFNYYNRTNRPIKVIEATASWTYSGTYRQVRASTANQINIMCGMAEDLVDILATSAVNGGPSHISIGIGLNSTTVNSAINSSGNSTYYASSIARYTAIPPLGLNSFKWLEMSTEAPASTFYGAGGATGGIQTGMIGGCYA